jgi:hypothetical protein
MEWRAGGMRERSTHSRTSRNTLFPSVVACKDYVEAKVRMDSRRRSRPQVTRERGNRGKKSPQQTRHRQTPFWPLLCLFCGYPADHCNASGENLLDAKLITSIFHRISTDRQPGASICSDSHAVRTFTRERAGYAGGNRCRRRPEAL